MPSPIFPPLFVVPLERTTDPCDTMYDSRTQKSDVPAAYTAAGWMQDIGIYRPANPVISRGDPILAFRGRPLDRVTYYASRITPRGSIPTGALPPAIQLDLWVGFNSVTSLQASVIVVPPSYGDDADWLFSFSGLTATQWELWGGAVDIGDPNRPLIPIQMGFDTLIDWSGCCTPELALGPWVLGP